MGQQRDQRDDRVSDKEQRNDREPFHRLGSPWPEAGDEPYTGSSFYHGVGGWAGDSAGQAVPYAIPIRGSWLRPMAGQLQSRHHASWFSCKAPALLFSSRRWSASQSHPPGKSPDFHVQI